MSASASPISGAALPILIAGGGTGGHVFPGLAVADALRALAHVEVTFAGTPRGLEGRLVPPRGYRLELLDVEPMTGGGAARAVRGAFVAAKATAEATRVVRRLAPRAVLSVGGYAAGPISLAAALLGIPVTVFEPNSVVGLTNRMLATVAKRAYVAWAEAGAPFRKSAVRLVGVPLRTGFVPTAYAPSGGARVLVMGGSQGAAALNERMPEALARVAVDVPALEVIHQAGKDRDDAVRAAYAREGFTRVKVVPFLEDVAHEIAMADVVVARAGAGTVAEIAAIGRASLLVPFPHAAADHQAKNAEALARQGGAIAIRQQAADATRITMELTRLLQHGDARVAMADAARAHGKPRAAEDLARDLLELAGIPLGGATPIDGARVTNGVLPGASFTRTSASANTMGAR
jgi:UDP-N-acetylglucosamine--N-acetylmuramyl-(pentapeptide) pyrophosphoryl-undecaprenol N-acetylglucosamine transferase